MSMTDIKWRFRRMSPSEINQGTVLGEFFGDEPINTRLVREAIQNSLDAGIDKVLGNAVAKPGPVRVRFSLAGIRNPLPAERAARYFTGLAPHLAATGDLPDEMRERAASDSLVSDGVPYLLIEDAGTMGLGGDWTKYDTNDSHNYFYWFFRNIGLSGKGDADNGSWGLGKWVFPDASRIRGYIAVTRRYPDGETLLMGQTVLNKHSIAGQRYDPFGYLAEQGEDGLPLPLRRSEPEHRAFIEQCIADFGLAFREAPGLSIIVPFPHIGSTGTPDDADDEASVGLNRRKLLDAVIRNYFYPIIAGSLEVTVDAGGKADATVVNRLTIDRVVTELALPETGEWSLQSYRRLFEMCRASLGRPDGEYEELPALPSGNRANYDAGQLTDWRNRYEAGELLAFRIVTDVDQRDKGKQQTGLQLYLQRDATLTEGQDYYVRGTLSIHGGMDFIKRRREACALLIVDEKEPLAAMLRDSEPPTHTVWNPGAGRAASRWVAAHRRIVAVRNTPSNLLAMLDAPAEEMQRDAFSDLFFGEGDRHLNGPNARKRGVQAVPPSQTSPPKPQDFNIIQTEGGFRLRLANGVKEPPARVALRVAYQIARGNPLNRYDENDFLLHRLHGRRATLTFQMGGCQIKGGKAGNELFLDIEDPDDFEFEVSGFDPRRDLCVSVERIANAEGDDAGTIP